MKIYIGTYGKYNNGSIEGEWVDLDALSSYEELCAKAHKIHKDEHSPEFMIQDTESDGYDWQAGYNSESISDYADYWELKAEAEKSKEALGTVTINKEKNGVEIRFYEKPSDNVLQDLKAHGWRWTRFSKCWYTRWSSEAVDYALKLVNAPNISEGSAETKDVAVKSSFFDEIRKKATANIGEYHKWVDENYTSASDRKYYKDRAVAAVKLDSGEWYIVEKQRITTTHCEGEDDGRGRSMKDAVAGCRYFETEFGFKSTNINRYRDIFRVGLYGIDRPGRREDYIVLLYSAKRVSIANAVEWKNKGWNEDTPSRPLSEREWKEIRRAYAWAIVSFRRRVNAYWKRFGNTKLRTWTYWTEA